MEQASWKLTKSIMILVMIVLLLCSLLLGYVLSSLRNSLLKSSQLTTEIIDHSLDSRLMELRKYSLNIELSSANSQTKRLATLRESDYPILYELVNLIQSYKYLNPLIEGIFIYYPKLDWIVGNIGSYASSSYYVLDNELQAEGYELFIQTIQEDSGEVLLIEDREQSKLYYRKKMLFQGNLVGYLLIRLDIDQLLLFSQRNLNFTNQDFAFSLSLDDYTFAISGNESLLFHGKKLSDGSYFLTNNLLLQTRSTSLRGLSYQLYLSLSDQLKPVSIALRTSIVTMLIIALLASVMAFFLGKKNTVPLMKLLQQVGAHEEQGTKDAYTLISMRIGELLRQKDDKIRALQYQREAMGPLFLHHLLSCRTDSEHAASALLRRYNISLEYPFYVIGVIRSEETSTTSLQALLSWARTAQVDVLAGEKEGDVVVLYTSDEYLNYESVVASLGSLLQENSLFRHARASLGTWHDLLSEAMQSYHEALLLLEDAKMGCWSFKQENKDCSSSLLLHAREAVSDNQLQYALSLLEELYVRYSQSVLETPFAENQFLEIERMLDISVKDVNVDLTSVKSKKHPIERCLELVKSLLRAHELETNGQQQSVAERAASIIEQEFTDPLLGLYRIAEELKLSSSYLSTTFKAQYGVGIVQYINQKRIDFAKELIVNTEMSIKDIALACGFSSDISFIRVFKRHEDKTPGTLRKT